MFGKEGIYAAACVGSGVVVAIGVFIALGGGPSPVFPLSIIVIGLGAALVVVRYGRLGPYQGAFGVPPVEAAIRGRVDRETERAVRYGREFSILAIRQKSRRAQRVANQLRGVDDVITCWKGITLILLPETSTWGAMQTYERIGAMLTEPAFAAIVSCPTDGVTGDEMVSRLLSLLQSDAALGEVVTSESQHNRASVAAI